MAMEDRAEHEGEAGEDGTAVLFCDAEGTVAEKGIGDGVALLEHAGTRLDEQLTDIWMDIVGHHSVEPLEHVLLGTVLGSGGGERIVGG